MEAVSLFVDGSIVYWQFREAHCGARRVPAADGPRRHGIRSAPPRLLARHTASLAPLLTGLLASTWESRLWGGEGFRSMKGLAVARPYADPHPPPLDEAEAAYWTPCSLLAAAIHSSQPPSLFRTFLELPLFVLCLPFPPIPQILAQQSLLIVNLGVVADGGVGGLFDNYGILLPLSYVKLRAHLFSHFS